MSGKNLPLVSIIIPVYNVEKFVTRSLESALQQSYQNIEIIAVNDGSTDKSLKILEELKAQCNFKIINQSNQGLSAARNTGIEQARGEYLCFLDSDDWYDLYFVENLIGQMIVNKCDIGVGKIIKVHEDGSVGKVYGFDAFKLFGILEAQKYDLTSIGITSLIQNKLFARHLFATHRFPKGMYFEDKALFYKILNSANRVCFSEGAIFYYFQRSGSIMNSFKDKYIFDRITIVNDLAAFYRCHDNEIELKKFVSIAQMNIIIGGVLSARLHSVPFHSVQPLINSVKFWDIISVLPEYRFIDFRKYFLYLAVKLGGRLFYIFFGLTTFVIKKTKRLSNYLLARFQI